MKNPRRSDINRARRAGYAYGFRKPMEGALPWKCPYTAQAMRIAWMRGVAAGIDAHWIQFSRVMTRAFKPFADALAHLAKSFEGLRSISRIAA